MAADSVSLAQDLMERDVVAADPDWNLAELERVLVEKKVSGLPVVEGDVLVGVVSRSDVIRALAVERSRAESLSGYFQSDDPEPEEELESHREQERFVAERLARERVADVMSPPKFVATPTTPCRDVAALLVEKRIHRLPVVDGDKLVGIITSLDLVELVARGHVR